MAACRVEARFLETSALTYSLLRDGGYDTAQLAVAALGWAYNRSELTVSINNLKMG